MLTETGRGIAALSLEAPGPMEYPKPLGKHGGNVTQTAQPIETPRSNLYKTMDHYDISREDA